MPLAQLGLDQRLAPKSAGNPGRRRRESRDTDVVECWGGGGIV